MAVAASSDQIHRVISTAVDAGFYRAVYLDLEGVDPVEHYAASGWREGRDPAPWFSTSDYLRLNADVAGLDVNPLYHFLTDGRREGRDAPVSAHAKRYRKGRERRGQEPAWSFEPGARPARDAGLSRPDDVAPLSDDDYGLAAPGFDSVYYRAVNDDVLGEGCDPLTHFLTRGWLEGRDPSPRFSVRDYLETYPDVASAGLNPFVHYLRFGRAEGRTPRSDLGFRYEVLARLQPLERRIAEVWACDDGFVGDRADLLTAFAVSRGGLRDLHISFSHDDYTAHVGGLQLCLQREAARLEALGRDHLHIHASKPFPVVRAGDEDCRLAVVWNGRALGAYDPRTVADALREAAGPVGKRSFAVHSLLGHRAHEVAAIVGAAGLTGGYFWIHDFAALCAGFHLMRDNVVDCGAPPPDSGACRICVYGPYRGRHIDEHARLFDRLDLTVVAPSQSALDTWRNGGGPAARAYLVHPHARLSPRAAAAAAAVEADGPVRLAFLGASATHKGWPVFRELAIRFADDPRYRFLHLARSTEKGLRIEHHEVTVTADRPLAMREQIEALGVDAALVWSLCRETFSFTAYEAVAAGAAVLTGPDSGNVAAFVEGEGHGLALPDEAALTAAFETGEILALARARRRPPLYDLTFSGMSLDLAPAAARP
jgi:hypothetical protein